MANDSTSMEFHTLRLKPLLLTLLVLILYGCTLTLYSFSWPPRMWPTLCFSIASAAFVLFIVLKTTIYTLGDPVEIELSDEDSDE